MIKKLGDKRKNDKRVVPANWNVYIATPAYDGRVDTDFAQSIAESSYVSPIYQVKLTHGVMSNGAFIDIARNIFVKKLLELHKECTHLFFIDSDLRWPANAFVGLIRSGYPICAGVYRRRQEPEDYPVRWINKENGELWLENDWLMCDRVPTGFLCITRKVIEEMAEDALQLNLADQPWPVPQLFYTKIDENNRYVGEDFCFCDDYVKKYDAPIPVWPDIDFIHGGYKCNFQDYLKRELDKVKAEQEKIKEVVK